MVWLTPVFVQDSVSPANDTHGSDSSLRQNDNVFVTEACANKNINKKVKERVQYIMFAFSQLRNDV